MSKLTIPEQKYTCRLNLWLTQDDGDTLDEIQERLAFRPADFIRTLTCAALDYYRAHGKFSFPVRIEPAPAGKKGEARAGR